MTRAPGGRWVFRRVFPRAMRLLLTLLAVAMVGFFGVANAARQTDASWPFRNLPVFLNPSPRDVRDRALEAMRQAAQEGPQAARARGELVRLGGAALPHVLPHLDSLEPLARGRVAMALGPVALRMRVASPDEVATPDRALIFFGRLWQDRSIEFRPTTVRRAVRRLSERSLGLRRDDVIHADTYALEALIAALGRVRSGEDVARVRRLNPVLIHITGLGQSLPPEPSAPQAAAAVEGWQRFWLEEGADFTVLEGPKRIAALVTETQFGKWVAQALLWRLGRAEDGSWVSHRVMAGLWPSAWHVLSILLLALGTAAASALLGGRADWLARARLRIAATAASLVASYPVVLTLALGAEVASGWPGVFGLCAAALRNGDVNLLMGALLGLTLLSELLVAVPARLAVLAGPQNPGALE